MKIDGLGVAGWPLLGAVDRSEVVRRSRRVDERGLAAFARGSDTLEQLVAGRLHDEGLVGVYVDRALGVAELIVVRVRRVVRAQIFDATKVRAADREPCLGESLDDPIGLGFGGGRRAATREPGGAVLAHASAHLDRDLAP